MKKPWLAALLLASLAIQAQIQTVWADEGSPLPDGVAITIDKEYIQLRVVSPHAFVLHISPTATTGLRPSVYLSGQTQPATPFRPLDDGTAVGISTDFGQLLVDPKRRMWTLRDASGATITDWTPLGTAVPAPPPQPGKPAQPGSFNLSIGSSSNTTRSLYYGSGNIPNLGALTQDHGSAKTGNGSAALPQYWSTAGYGALLVGDTDDQPGSWKVNPAGGVDWRVPGSGADLYLFPTRDLYAWLRADAELTGFAPVPPLWSFGYLQSRWGWKNKAYIDDTLVHFRQDQLPVDAFIVDFEWYTTKPDYQVKYEGEPTYVDFGWNPALFPDPQAQIAGFAAQGLHLIGIRKPRLGNSENLAMARNKGWILPPNPADPNYWVIRSRNLDFSLPDVRTYWKENNRKFLEAGLAAFWNDEGESDYVEYSYWNIAELSLFAEAKPGERFWSLNRSFIPGMQRFGAAVWTGDIAADWKPLERTPGEMLSYGLSGMPYSACDIGGYSGNTTPELLSRWMEAGVFFPIMRSHSENSSTPHFPWLFGPDAEAAIRKALDLRYQLIPYYYSLSHENATTAAPLMRPLVMEFPADANAVGLTDEWLMGKSLLAAPVLNAGGARSIYLPADGWFDFGTSHSTQGPQTVQVTAKLDEIPMYVRAGTLLPLGPVRQYTGEPSQTPLEMQIYPGHDATFDLVEDDGKTLDYQKGTERITHFSWDDRAQTLSWKVTGTYDGAGVFSSMKAVLFAPQGSVEKDGTLGRDGSAQFP
jgi:alpha-glucosidase